MLESSTDWARVRELFETTFEESSEERARALRLESNEHIRQRVIEMLAAHDAADGGVLDRPAVDTLDPLLFSKLSPAPSLVGRRLGAYRVVREIGRGGMGAVYEALRDDAQFEHRVAIKTLRLGIDSESVLRRFDQERRILAGLQHPNIAALYDGAVSDDGLPYFVLEFVDGLPVDRHCVENKLTLRERIALFLQVISAAQYAHQLLIVHRDIKPGNILVTRAGVAKLVDFGIAKLLTQEPSHVTG